MSRLRASSESCPRPPTAFRYSSRRVVASCTRWWGRRGMATSRSSLASLLPGRLRLPGRLAPADGPASGEPDISIEGESSLVTRCLRSLAGAFVIVWAFRLDGYLTFTPWLALPVVFL